MKMNRVVFAVPFGLMLHTLAGCAGPTEVRITQQTRRRPPEPLDASAPPDVALLPDGVSEFIQQTDRNETREIDWTHGYIRVEGRGVGKRASAQGKLEADRAAVVVALRNAVALAAGISVDASGSLGGVRDGRVRIEGTIKGFTKLSSTWDPDKKECRVVIECPLWGVEGVAEVFVGDQRAKVARGGRERLTLSERRVDVSDFVILIDARDAGVKPCLFPTIVDDAGRIVYDINTMRPNWAGRVPTVRYVTTDLPYEDLRAELESLSSRRVLLARYQPPDDGKSVADKPKSKKKKGRRDTKRSRKYQTAKGIKPLNNLKTQIKVTRDAAKAMTKTPEGASALRNGQIVVATRQAAAGAGARLPTLREVILASASSRQ